MREVYTESLMPRHSGISNDILLFSDIGLSLSHHYRVHKKGCAPRRIPQGLYVSVTRYVALACGSVGPKGISGVGLFGIGGVAGGGGQLSTTVQTCVRSQTHTPGQGDTHTNSTSSDGIRPAGRGGSNGVRLSAPSAARGDGVRRCGTGGDMFYNEGLCSHISTFRTWAVIRGGGGGLLGSYNQQ